MNKIKLRALTKSDIEYTLKWHNSDDIRRYYLGHPFPINREMEEKWYEKILYSNYPTTVFGIELIPIQKLIGITILSEINFINRSAKFSIYIGDSNEKGKGYSKEAAYLTLRFGFKHLNLNRIFLNVLEENKLAIKLYQDIGMVREGVLRSSVYKNGEYKNEIIFSILASEFKEKNNV